MEEEFKMTNNRTASATPMLNEHPTAQELLSVDFSPMVQPNQGDESCLEKVDENEGLIFAGQTQDKGVSNPISEESIDQFRIPSAAKAANDEEELIADSSSDTI